MYTLHHTGSVHPSSYRKYIPFNQTESAYLARSVPVPCGISVSSVQLNFPPLTASWQKKKKIVVEPQMQFLLLYYLIMGQAHMLSKLGYMLSKLGHVLSKLGHMLSKLGHVLSKPVQFTHQSKTTLSLTRRYNDQLLSQMHNIPSVRQEEEKKTFKKNF